MSVTYCGSKLDLGSQVRKFSEGIECFSVEAFDDLLDGENKKKKLSYLMMAKNKLDRLMMSQ